MTPAAMPEDFTPIPAWPGYFVNRLGQVRSNFGTLTVDPKGRVRVRPPGGKSARSVYVGELMAAAGFFLTAPPAASAEMEAEVAALRHERDILKRQVNGLRSQLAAASETIDRGRKLNGHLLFLVRKHQGKCPQETLAREELA